MCQDDTKCQAWTRDLNGGQCYLKSSLTSTGQAPNWIWGTKCEAQGWKGCTVTKGKYLVSGNIITSKWTGNNEVRKLHRKNFINIKHTDLYKNQLFYLT